MPKRSAFASAGRFFLLISILLHLNLLAFTSAEESSSTEKSTGENRSNGILLLTDVLQQVNLYHPKLAGADLQRRIATAKRIEKQGAFDPSLNGASDYIRYNSSSKRGQVAESTDNEFSLDFLTRSGVKVSSGVDLNFGKVKSPGNPTGDAGNYFIDIKAPLLRGFLINEKSAAERQALLGEPLADAEYFFNRLELLLKASEAYWDWVASKQKMDIAQDLLQLAEFRATAVKERSQAGDLPLIDGVEANQEVQRRLGALVKAQREFQKATFKLSLYLWQQNGQPSPLPESGAAPAVVNRPIQYSEQDGLEGKKIAYGNRPELRRIELERRITKVDFDLAKNLRLPLLNVNAGPGLDLGAGGVGANVKVGGELSIPLRQRTAKGRMEAARLKIEKLTLDEQIAKRQIEIEVDDVLSAINTTFHRYQAAEQEVELAKQLETGEQEKFKFGDSTLFLVNQRERSTAEAQMKLVDILAEYQIALVTFLAVTGQL